MKIYMLTLTQKSHKDS